MLITNATIITWDTPNQILEDQALYIENDRIREVGSSGELKSKYPESETLDARGQIVMPGSICAHTHFYGAFARGMAIPGLLRRISPKSCANSGGRLIKR